MRRVHRFALITVMISGAALLGSALYVPAKAVVGQHLLESAWEEAKAQHAAEKTAIAAAEPATPDPGVEGDAEAPLIRPWAWADIAPIAKIAFPRLGETRIVLDSASGEAMAWGPGHVAGTAPLGAPGLSAAAAHRDTHFALLEEVKPGDLVEVETVDGDVIQYRVSFGQVVDSETWRFPDLKDGPDVLALSTCWPFDAKTQGPERFVLFADRVEPSEVAADDAS